MSSFQQFWHFFLTISLTVVLTTTMSFGSADSWAATSLTQFIPQPQAQIATMNQAEAMTKNAEGKVQETIGNITGNINGQNMGKAKQVESQNRNLKQAESQARHAAIDMKDKVESKILAESKSSEK